MAELENRTYPAVDDLYQAANKNYPWEGFKYVVPGQYHHNDPNHPPPPSKPSPKLSYVDHLLRAKKSIPAPNAYHPVNEVRPLSGKMDRKPRTTITDEAIAKNKRNQVPGPGAYMTRPQTAGSKFNRNAPEYRQHYLHQVQYLSSECPGVGEYNVNNNRGHVSAPRFFKPSKSVSSARIKTEKYGKDVVSTTLVAGTFEWLSKQKKSANKNFFGKSKRFDGPSKYEKKPGPTSYKLNHKWNDERHILKTASSFSNLKSVYYS